MDFFFFFFYSFKYSVGKFSLLRDTDKASWPKIRSSSCVLNQGPTCALHTLFPLCLSASLSCFREQPFWVNFNIHVFPGTTRKVHSCNQMPCLYVFMKWQNPEQKIYVCVHVCTYFYYFTKPSSSIILTQNTYGDVSLHSPPTPTLKSLN